MNKRHISGFGSGFLPTFGPSFVCFYGAPRENGASFDHLNLGFGQGCAYRGRVLLAVETKLGEKPDEDQDEDEDEQVEDGKEKEGDCLR